ncbi:MAG: hypothetical protein IIW11_03025 [Bacteroidales bacterium]|nr:hypothetical protein [Bacteroidales bacterium]
MVGKLVKTIYKYEDVQLESGAVVTAMDVTVQDSKVVNVGNGVVRVEDKSFSFSIFNYGINGDITYSLNNMPADVDGQKIVKEFVLFVESDI